MKENPYKVSKTENNIYKKNNNDNETINTNKKIWAAFSQPSAWILFFFGFASGLPFLLIASTLSYWLKEESIHLKEITMIAGAGITYSIKFLWSPLVDRLQLPILKKLGQRRSWILLAQFNIMLGLLGMAYFSPKQLDVFIIFTLWVAFFGATLDIAVDAYRIEIAPDAEQQAAVVATYSLGYRIALIISGAVALILSSSIRWNTIYILLATLMAFLIYVTVIAKEPVNQKIITTSWKASFQEGVIEPFRDFFTRFGSKVSLLLLGFILLFKMPDQAMGNILPPFYLDQGYLKLEIASITKIYGVWLGIFGAFLASIIISYWGLARTLLLAVILGALSNLLYLLLIYTGKNTLCLILVISGENLAQGLLGTTAVAFLSLLVNPRYTATQYALLASLAILTGKIASFFSGMIAEYYSYSTYFILSAVSVIPAVILFYFMRKKIDYILK